jgi:hypothetical protein
LGQKLKSSMGVYVFRSAPNNGHAATTAACPKSANNGHQPVVYPVKNAFGLSSDPSYSIQWVGLTCHAAKAAKPDRTQVVGHIGR